MDENRLREEVRAARSTDRDVAPLVLNRWSPRAMTGEPLDEEAITALFEAARWAPSSRNSQPWRYRYATRESEEWATFFDLLSEGNKRWAHRAAVLIVVCSKTTYEGSTLRTATFSTGASWENLALEGTRRDLVVHPIAGFDRAAAREALSVPEDLRVEVMTAVGHRGSPDVLSERDRDRERPSGRRRLDDLVGEGGFED